MATTSDAKPTLLAGDAARCRPVVAHLLWYALAGAIWVLASGAALAHAGPLSISAAVALSGVPLVAAISVLFGIQVCRLLREQDELYTRKRAAIAERTRTIELLEAVASSSTDIITAKDLDGRYLFVNRAAEQLLRRTRAEILGHTVAEVMPVACADAVEAHDRAARGADSPQTFEENAAGGDGMMTYLSNRGPLHDAAGRVVGSYGISRDITPRERLTQAIRERESDFRMLAEQAPAIIYRAALDADSTTLYVSPGIAQLGYTPEEWIGDPQAWSRATHPDDAVRVGAAFESMRRDGGDLVLEYRLRDKAGRWHHFRDIARILRDESGQALFVQGVMIDVSNRVAAGAALAASERRYAFMLDVIDDAIWDWDVSTGTGFASPAYFRMLGEEACTQITLDAFLARVHPDDLPGLWQQELHRLADTQTRVELEFRLRHADGRWIWVQGRGRILECDAAGRTSRVVGTLRDISERKRTQEDLRESEERLRNLFQQVTDGVFVVGSDGRFRDANPEGLAMLGCSRQEFDGLCLHDVLVEFERYRQEPDSHRLVGAGPPLVEWELMRRDGSRFAAEVTSRPAGRDCSLLVVRDVTQRNADIARLRWLSQAVEQCSESIVITDVHARIVYANAAALASSGYALEELLGCNPRLLKSGETPAETHRSMWSHLNRGEPWKGHLFNRRKDGRRYVEFALMSPMRDADGRTTHFVAVKEDVTDKLRIEQELEQHRHHLERLVETRTSELALAMNAAESANRAKGAFLATMSHELRTPMNGVIGTLDVLRRSSLTPNQLDLTAMIRESAFVLLRVIDDILDFSKIEAGKLELEREPVSPAQLVEGVSESLEAVAAGRRVRLRVFADPGLPAWILSDALRLRQILNNLLGNAIKFSAGLDRTGQVELIAEPDGPDRVRLTVRDNGIGMAPEVQERVFEPFSQAENSTTRRYGGSGLGLSICRRLVELLGGSIEMVSAAGQGTTLAVTLPTERVEGHRPSSGEGHDLSGLAVWVAVSDTRQALRWSAYLAAAGAAVRPWPGPEAWAKTGSAAGMGLNVLVAELAPEMSQPLLASCAAQGIGLVLVDDVSPRKPVLLAPALAALGAGAMRRAALEEAVALVSGRAKPAEPLEEPPIEAAPPNVEAALRKGRLVLVAEDNEINQELIRRQLALLEVQCEIASDGAQALALWRSGRFAMLLTDLHMPEMNGYGLAARIRIQECPGERLPIVALTANATKGEADRCMAVGMDEYLTKPVDLDRLQAVFARWLPRPASARGASPQEPVPGAAADLPVLDAAVLPRMIGPDPALLARFQRDYLVSARETVEAVRRAADAASWPAAAALAHRLKSSSRAVGALALGEVCAQLEDTGKSDEPGAALSLVSALESALRDVVARLGERPAPATREPPEPIACEPRIMLVDDEPFQLQLLKQQVRDLGLANCDTSTSGPAMLESLRGRDTSNHLTLLDLDMPGMDGVEVIRHLSEQRYAGALAVISGADERLLEAASRLAGAHRLDMLRHLHKPVPLDALGRLVEEWRRRRQRSAVPARPLSAYQAADIRTAIASGRMLLHYQPKVCLKTGDVEGVEALVRWQHPVDGLVTPDRFVSVAEAHGLIDALTREVIAQAVNQASRWRRSGLSMRVAVNVSMDNLTRLDFPELVFDELARAEVPATDLLLEVTESRLMQDARAPLDILTRLRLKQIRLSIDDFGTGHSSLAQLRDIPFDELKIDRSFVHGAGRRPTECAIFEASLGMAHQLGMRAIAEGVEDRADWDFARDAGCDAAQGYFVARPMPAEAIAAWVDEWKDRRGELLS